MAEDKKEKTLREKLDAVNFSNEQATKISNIMSENQKLKDMIAAKNKSSRGPSMAERVQGLEGLKNTLGKQFSK